tara:strand:- start:928 stop:1254 length:327 start_codon:yes stop_codon:yes gene_type:complete
LEYAEHEFSLNKSDDGNISRRQHLEQVEKQTGIKPKELDGPKFPYLMSYVWTAFLHISGSRSMGFNSPNAITYQEIQSWVELTQTPLDAREVEAVKYLDTIFMRSMNG